MHGSGRVDFLVGTEMGFIRMKVFCPGFDVWREL